eukprot:gnl/MRDRNA2_/MRDRNA2_114112_c0_seq1.p1 gnl/MRDRNA2_/MRDRNA2_114112_c0~~gnl/MRDRNA2_/MRDRNA2_114112_c0_seq1.p1  ORF type:complete len:498 (-),score=96.06 gnl/MRDRNA2_/MRDRNA2_114112_c0_seq1:274-1722(-)
MISAVLGVCILRLASAHPSAVAGGRPTCGAEFDSPLNAYVVPDITEAWYLRRIATCASPYFWITWNGTANSDLYIAVISPEIERFADKLQYHAILFGPGLPEVTPPAGVPAPLPTGKELVPPKSYDTCAFVDTNPVMRRFSDVIEGRCMEQLQLAADYKDPLRAGKTWDSWWLYSHEHVHADTGQYYLVSWLTDRSGKLAQGKYEVTMGPWSWSGYAEKDVMERAHQQLSTCSCASNVVAYLEQHVERLGSPPVAAWEAELPATTCDVGGQSACVAADPAQLMDGVEWSGSWSLEKGMYRWTYYAFGEPYAYPDRNMLIVAKKCIGLKDAEASVHDAMQKTHTDVHPGSQIAWSSGAQRLIFNADEVDESTPNDPFTYFELDVAEAGMYCIFTQHVPAEFLATYLFCEKCNHQMKYPDDTRLYVIEPATKTESQDDGQEEMQEEKQVAVSSAYVTGIASRLLFTLLYGLLDELCFKSFGQKV